MNEVKFRNTELADLPHVVEIERASFEDPYPPEYLDMLMRFSQGIFIIAERDGIAIGYAVASTRERTGHVLSIAVNPKERGRGVGKGLMERMIEELKAREASKIVLESKKGNPAIKFYLSLGFRQVGTMPAYYDDGSEAILMELDLTKTRLDSTYG